MKKKVQIFNWNITTTMFGCNQRMVVVEYGRVADCIIYAIKALNYTLCVQRINVRGSFVTNRGSKFG